MEISATTFTWMRDVGCMTTQHVTASRTRGMLALTNAGVHSLLAGRNVVRLLHHYCCSRFDVPSSLVPDEGATPAEKRHNWSIVGKILKDALEYELAWERRELIVQGDIVEVVVLLKQIQDLVARHRAADRESQIKHRLMSESPAKVDIAARLSKPFNIGEERSPRPHDKPWTHNMSRRPPAKLPPLEPRAPKRVKPLLPPEARLPPKASTPQPRRSADNSWNDDHGGNNHRGGARRQQTQQPQHTVITEADL
uniref:Uncharacterized protein n=1 Tax=Neobodo designis TaxID=312471 RepID=A0A7S1L345_NEODS|mmetsp:Transcript_127/g.467  ORF Transcript_127/g.467 Transcript_127/m.467 type:complete len:253 (+) Transcript_127:227-985(+)|eukprot:CAMPEP_0174855420 /NCGR_PEP_ID=MMETSP1114-20130205/33225_1 /TAXON_ID=312471 /ORGANISM="Neobodo designis, Strain CCAP 1951/1" /LENGTH=252 /DNA_ID=CAMNT_0016090159 /DNA_START=227 /DNA_END=985 /DNA_ORIENTATION=+